MNVEGHALLQEKMSSELLMRAWALNPNLLHETGKDIQDLVQGFYRNGMSIFSESASKFLPKICDYFVQQELHEFRLWLSSRITGFDEQDLMSGKESSIDFHLIQKCAEVIAERKGEEVWNNNEVMGVSVLMSGLFCHPAADPVFLSKHINEIQESFPFISKSLPSFGIVIDEAEYSCSSLYYVLRRSTSLDLTKCFRWQEKNLFRESHQELPSFARHFIPGFKGLDNAIDTLYFIREGRPCHAFVKGSGLSQDRVADALNLASSVGSKRTEVLCSEVLFQEIVLKNSWSLRLHLTAANFVGKYAADFLGLKFRQQENALGSLLKACLKKTSTAAEEDDASVIKMLSLLVAAFERKYHEKRKVSVEECLEWELVHHFCQEHSLEPACELMIKCAQNDDWLLFVVCAQIYDVPKQITLDILSSFNNRCIADHLEKAFRSSYTTNEKDENPIAILKGKGKNSQFSSRQGLYSKIGVAVMDKEARKKSSLASPTTPESPESFTNHPFEDYRSTTSDAEERLTSMTDTISVMSHGSAGTSVTGLETITSLPPPVDLYNLIMEAQRRTQQSFEETILAYGIHLKNPILVLFSASLNPASIPSSFDILSFWLSSAFKPGSYSLPIGQTWDTSHFCSLIWSGIRSLPNLRNLRMGLQLFDYEKNPFFHLVQFFVEFTLEKKFLKSVDSLKYFQECFWKFKTDVPSNPLENQNDLSHICATLIEACLISLDDFYETKLLLRHLDFARVHSMFPPSTKIANFNRFSRMCQTVQETDFEIPVGSLISLSESSDEYRQIMENLCRSLQQEGYFVEASQLAALASLNMDDVVINEWRIKVKNNMNDISFWKNLFLQITKSVHDKLTLFNFLVEIETEPKCRLEIRLFVFCYLFGFLSHVSKENSWKVESFVYENLVELEESGNTDDSFSEVWSVFEQSMKSSKTISHEITIREVPITEDKKNILDKIIGRMPSLDTAIRFSRYFGYHSKDADILQVCHRLSTNGSLAPEDFQHCIDCLSLRVTERLNSAQIFEVTDVLIVMEELTLKASYTKSICQRTTLQFKIALALGKTFQEISETLDSMSVIRNLISAAGSPGASSGQIFTAVDLINLAKEFISCYKIEDAAVAKLVLHEVNSGMNREVKDNVSIESSASTEGGSGAGFLSLLRLLNDPSVLGKHILINLRGGFLDDQPLSHAVELYIRAHDCFTVCSDIEGISLVLRNVRQLVIQQLAPANDYNSMIRLLTGIGRYSEMTYIFDLLKEHHKFELLLGKRIEKSPQLRIALLDSLKGDKEMYPLVALNFSMHREIAEMTEDETLKNMKNMAMRRTLTTGNLKDILDRCMSDLVDAADSYSRASCYNQSRKCALLAELVALQISLLPKNIDILAMSPQTVSDFIAMHQNCAESMIIAEAYYHQRSWAAALLNNVVKRGDWSYLREFVALKGPIPPSLLHEVCVKTIHEIPHIQGTSIETNLIKLINSSKGDVEGIHKLVCKFRQSNLRDLIKKINIPSEGDESVYLQDLMRNSSSNF
jgi:spatacsin